MNGIETYREEVVYLPYELLPWQKNVKADFHRNIVIVAGRRSGKTHFLCDKEIEAATTFAAGLPCWYVAPTYGMAKDIAWVLLKEFTRDLHRAGIVKRYYETELRIDFITGAQIHLKGADNVDSLRGRGLGFLGVDEIAIMKHEVWDEVLRPAVADKKAPVVFIGTPKGYNHFHKLSIMEETDPENWKTYRIKTSEAGTIALGELEQARRDMDERAFKQEFEASFETFGGQVFPEFSREKHVKEFAFEPSWEFGMGMDFGWAAPTASLFIQVDPQENVFVFDEVGARETPIAEVVKLIRGKGYKRPRVNERGFPIGGKDDYITVPDAVMCDPAGASKNEALGTSSVQELRNAFGPGVAVRYKQSAVVDGLNTIRKWLRNGKLFIHPRCANLIKAFEMYRYPDPKGDIRTEVPLKDGISDHWMDALRYFFVNRFFARATVGVF